MACYHPIGLGLSFLVVSLAQVSCGGCPDPHDERHEEWKTTTTLTVTAPSGYTFSCTPRAAWRTLGDRDTYLEITRGCDSDDYLSIAAHTVVHPKVGSYTTDAGNLRVDAAMGPENSGGYACGPCQMPGGLVLESESSRAVEMAVDFLFTTSKKETISIVGHVSAHDRVVRTETYCSN